MLSRKFISLLFISVYLSRPAGEEESVYLVALKRKSSPGVRGKFFISIVICNSLSLSLSLSFSLNETKRGLEKN